ncbi:phosphonate C-P lyase system protein PhnL [Marinobacter maroccanus]|uniref:Phosphonate C-P lyase system protein PhnL n=1 Tax=Marinobacter maroccanus TaxID=2055143 RepID=A0A2S5Z723_9GAMM|nr:phosphonate C-P lyase system protein PhnL [Marinobacter maroccanus]PPI83032.1 phosphonate C-P lyase system protein PhnL [Marinobacter maroccanus]
MTNISETPILDVQGLAKQFRLHAQDELVPSCSDVNMRAFPGQLAALTGPTGAGKSSVLKCIYRTYLPSEGSIHFRRADGEVVDLARISEQDMLHLRLSELGFVTQFLHCVPRRPADEVVAEPLILRGMALADALAQARELLRRLNVPERLWRLPPATFSGGEKQRVNLARGLIAKPRLLLLDEPTASLDKNTTGQVIELLREFKQAGVAMVAIFHDPELVTALADAEYRLAPPQSLSHSTPAPEALQS